MDYTLMPSLQHRALIKTAITLWNINDIKGLLVKENKTKKTVMEKVPLLPLPVLLRKFVLGFIKPIGLEIASWMKFHKNLISQCCMEKSLSRLCWTSLGTIDLKKTAEILVEDEDLDITKRYELACIYCLEDLIRELWSKIPENCRNLYYKGGNPDDVKQLSVVVFWTYDIIGEVAKMDNMIERRLGSRRSPYQYVFESVLQLGNRVATEYFFNKLTSDEKTECLVHCINYAAFMRSLPKQRKSTFFPKRCNSDVVCFLLSQMDEDQQAKLFKSCSLKMLRCFLDWPWQSLFMQTINRVWNDLYAVGFYNLFEAMVNKELHSYTDYDYQYLRREFWQQSLDSHKRYFIKECLRGSLLKNMLIIKDDENIKQILKDATPTEKRNLVFSPGGKCLCRTLVNGGNLCFLNFYVRECLTSETDVVHLKKRYHKEFPPARVLPCHIEKWDSFFQLLDDYVISLRKRKRYEEGEVEDIDFQKKH